MSAADQVALATKLAFGLDVQRWKVSIKAIKPKLQDRPESPLSRLVLEWSSEAIVRDICSLRNLATHQHYDKDPGPEGWELDKPDPEEWAYDGPRGLVPYCENALHHMRRLGPIIKTLEGDAALW